MCQDAGPCKLLSLSTSKTLQPRVLFWETAPVRGRVVEDILVGRGGGGGGGG